MKQKTHEKEIVQALRHAVADQLGTERFDLWLADTTWRYDEGRLTIRVPDAFRFARFRASSLCSEIAAASHSIVGQRPAVVFEQDTHPCDPEAAKPADARAGQDPIPLCNDASTDSAMRTLESTRTASSPAPTGVSDAAPAGRRFARLDEFVSGACNQVAVASTRMMLDTPGQVSPLSIYGPPGTGKTHLLEGIWTTYRKRFPKHRCVFLTSEQFTSYFVAAVNGRGMPSFRQRYRDVQLLVIEDLQFFSNKKATLVELQYTLDAVLRAGGQLVFSADRAPTELEQLGDEIIHRLAGGLMAPLDPLDVETRCKLLHRFAKQRNFELPDDVAHMVAGQVAGDARQLRGIIMRLKVHCAAFGVPVTCGVAMDALKDIVKSSVRMLQLDDIERAVCDVFGIDVQNLRSANRTRRVSQPRMLAMWLARKHTSSALSEIGEHFGKRSHSTVVSAEKKVNSLVSSNARIRWNDGSCHVEEAIRMIESRLRAG